MGIRDDYLAAATTAVDLLREPAVAAAWPEPSVLEDFSVGGLAAHLANQILHISEAEPVSPGAPISILDNYSRAPWVGENANHEVNIAIRNAGERAGSDGSGALVARVTQALEEDRTFVDSAPDGLVVHLPRAGWDLAFDDFLLTRLMEIAVHLDDLAVSARIPTPELPESAAFAVTDLLSRLAIRRHGLVPVLRALSRSERAPETISAL